MNKLVSVIIPVYNAEKYLEECLISITNQTYQYYEIIIIDDGSTDNSSSICKAFALQHKAVYYKRIINGGASNARNVAMTLARGDYYVFVDSDDIVAPSYLDILVNLMKQSQMGIVGYTSNIEELESASGKNAFINRDPNEMFTKMLDAKAGIDGYLWNKIFDAKIIRAQGLHFPVGIKIWEDMYFVLRYLKCISVCCQNNCKLYYYRIHNSSAVQKVTAEKIKSKMQISKHFVEMDTDNSTFTKAAKRVYCNTWIEYCMCLLGENKLTVKEKLQMLKVLWENKVFFTLEPGSLKNVIKILVG